MIEQPDEPNAPGGLAAEVLARCDEVALFVEEPDKITRTFLSEPMRGLHRADDPVDGRGRPECSP